MIPLAEQLPERHLECSECKKPIHVIYTEVVGKMIYKIGMCNDCPILKNKLYGTSGALSRSDTLQAGLCCGNCGTTAEEVRMGATLGCPICYEVFGDLLSQELAEAERLPMKSAQQRKSASLHIGKLPGQTPEINPGLKLLALHQALNETLSREDYEQAAWLRDQIKELTEGSEQ